MFYLYLVNISVSPYGAGIMVLPHSLLYPEKQYFTTLLSKRHVQLMHSSTINILGENTVMCTIIT